MTVHRLLAACLVAAVVFGSARPAAAQLEGPIPAGRVTAGTLSFDGHASVGDFTGTTHEVTGEMSAAAGLAEVRGWVEAPVRSLETGNRKRDRDLNKSMESDKYPVIRFELTGVTPGGGAADSAAATLAGRMVIHGVAREVSLPAVIRSLPEGLQVRTHFPLDLKDYEIGGLTKMLGMLRMQEQIEVRVDLTFATR